MQTIFCNKLYNFFHNFNRFSRTKTGVVTVQDGRAASTTAHIPQTYDLSQLMINYNIYIIIFAIFLLYHVLKCNKFTYMQY